MNPIESRDSSSKKPVGSLPELTSLRAIDLMSKDLVTALLDTPIEDVLSRFEDYQISALPVVDESGKPLGIISKADIARVEHMRNEKLEGRPGDPSYAEAVAPEDEADFPGREDYSPEVLGRALASDWMHPAVTYVSPEATLAEICGLMVQERIHHLVVLESSRVIGMISSLDIVRAVSERI